MNAPISRFDWRLECRTELNVKRLPYVIIHYRVCIKPERLRKMLKLRELVSSPSQALNESNLAILYVTIRFYGWKFSNTACCDEEPDDLDGILESDCDYSLISLYTGMKMYTFDNSMSHHNRPPDSFHVLLLSFKDNGKTSPLCEVHFSWKIMLLSSKVCSQNCFSQKEIEPSLWKEEYGDHIFC